MIRLYVNSTGIKLCSISQPHPFGEAGDISRLLAALSYVVLFVPCRT